MAESIRLNKLLAQQLGVGRRQADQLIESGRVSVNGQTVRLGQQIGEHDTITLNGQTLKMTAPAYIYLALNKPVGYVCSRRQQGDAPTIYSLLPKKYHHLQPVGRLDKDSSGLLLLTNDGDFALRMTHPRFHKTKTYEVTLDKPLQPNDRQAIHDHGIELPDGRSKLRLEPIDKQDRTWCVIMHEGRNRQIRRTFAALGYTVVRLHRTKFGAIVLGSLAKGRHVGLNTPEAQ